MISAKILNTVKLFILLVAMTIPAYADNTTISNDIVPISVAIPPQLGIVVPETIDNTTLPIVENTPPAVVSTPTITPIPVVTAGNDNVTIAPPPTPASNPIPAPMSNREPVNIKEELPPQKSYTIPPPMTPIRVMSAETVDVPPNTLVVDNVTADNLTSSDNVSVVATPADIPVITPIPGLTFNSPAAVIAPHFKLFHAAAMGDIKTIKEFHAQGNDIKIVDEYNNTLLMIAAENGHDELVQYLFKNGVNPNIRNKFGYAALYSAVINKHTSVIKLLHSLGVSDNIPNKFGSTIADYLSTLGLASIDEYIGYLETNSKVYLQGPYSLYYTTEWEQKLLQATFMGDDDSMYLLLKQNNSTPTVEQAYFLGLYELKHGVGDGESRLMNASDMGHKDAFRALGQYLVDKDDNASKAKGIDYLQKATAAGDYRAETMLGRAYLYGNGVPKDEKKAFAYFSDAAQRGDNLAVYYRGLSLYYGLGVAIDRINGLVDIKTATLYSVPESLNMTRRFASEDTMRYMADSKELNRQKVNTYMLSNGGVVMDTVDQCDRYSVGGFFSTDYTITEMVFCEGDPHTVTFAVSPDHMTTNVYDILTEYSRKANVAFAPSLETIDRESLTKNKNIDDLKITILNR